MATLVVTKEILFQAEKSLLSVLYQAVFMINNYKVSCRFYLLKQGGISVNIVMYGNHGYTSFSLFSLRWMFPSFCCCQTQQEWIYQLHFMVGSAWCRTYTLKHIIMSLIFMMTMHTHTHTCARARTHTHCLGQIAWISSLVGAVETVEQTKWKPRFIPYTCLNINSTTRAYRHHDKVIKQVVSLAQRLKVSLRISTLNHWTMSDKLGLCPLMYSFSSSMRPLTTD